MTLTRLLNYYMDKEILYHIGNQFSAIFIQVKNLSSSLSDGKVEILTADLKKFAEKALQGGSSGDSDSGGNGSDSGSGASCCVPFVTMVMLVGSGEKDEEELVGSSKRWSVHSDDEGNVHVVLRGLTPCERFIPKELQKCLRSYYWNMVVEVQNHFETQVELPKEYAILAAAGMKSTCF